MGAQDCAAAVPPNPGHDRDAEPCAGARWLEEAPDPARMFCDATHERVQAVTRILVSAVAAVILLVVGRGESASGGGGLLIAAGGLGGYALLSTLYLWSLRRLDRERRWPWRQVVVITTDLTMVAAASTLLGSAGLGLYPILLWIIVVNGVCFGPRYLGFAAAVAVLEFAVAHLVTGVAMSLPMVYVGLLGGLIVLPWLMQQKLVRMIDSNRALIAQKARAEHQALHDTLTDLPNRHLLLQRMDHAIHRARRSGMRLAVLFLDLDGFKRVNDSQGHDAGDDLLIQLARCLAGSVRETDTLCRLGGDEFVLLIEDCGSARDLNRVIDRLFGCARRLYKLQDQETWVTWSCGVAVYPRDGGDCSTLMRNADLAMYRAKARGGDCCIQYNPSMSRQVLRDLALRTELRRAVDNREFLVYYQPQVDATGGVTLAVEALVRWRHPGRGVLAPSEFLSVALMSGLMAEVDALVLEIALRDLADLRRGGVPNLRLAVNLSARQLANADFATWLDGLLARHGLAADVLDIETTETTFLEETDNIRELIRTLRGRGIRFVLDDFGTGYSSLAHLRRFDLDLVKIDHSFIRGLPGDEGDRAMVEGILAVAGRLGLRVAAEGVETAAQRDLLLARGCTWQQGFHYAGPLPLAALRELLVRGPSVA